MMKMCYLIFNDCLKKVKWILLIASLFPHAIQGIHTYKDTEIRIIPKNKSLSIIKEIIETSPIQYFRIAVFFDFDDTLTHTEGRIFKRTYLHGGHETRELITFLNEHKINWFINTANGFGPFSIKSTAKMVKKLGLEFPSWYNTQCYDKQSKHFTIKRTLYKDAAIEQCNNIISAGFNKELATEFILKDLDPYPSLIIFVDDNPQNILNMYDYFSVGNGKNKKTHFIGLVYKSPYMTHDKNTKVYDRIQKLIEEHHKQPLEYRKRISPSKHFRSIVQHILPLV